MGSHMNTRFSAYLWHVGRSHSAFTGNSRKIQCIRVIFGKSDLVGRQQVSHYPSDSRGEIKQPLLQSTAQPKGVLAGNNACAKVSPSLRGRPSQEKAWTSVDGLPGGWHLELHMALSCLQRCVA